MNEKSFKKMVLSPPKCKNKQCACVGRRNDQTNIYILKWWWNYWISFWSFFVTTHKSLQKVVILVGAGWRWAIWKMLPYLIMWLRNINYVKQGKIKISKIIAAYGSSRKRKRLKFLSSMAVVREFLVHGPLRKIDFIAAYASKLHSPNKPQPIH